MGDETSIGEGASSSDGGEHDSAYQEALAETRRVIDVQAEMAENTDEEMIMLLRINILVLGGVVTLIAYVPNLITAALPWVVLSGIFLVFSILVATYIYRGITLYAGFGDHGYDEHSPKQKLAYDLLIESSPDRSAPDQPPLPESVPSAEEFRAYLLSEHQAGISHNNIEIKYRSQIHQQVVLLLVFGIAILGVGIGVALTRPFDRPLQIVSLLVTLFATLACVYTAIKSIGLICRFTKTKADPDRLSYGYAFERKYPYFSRICSFVTSNLYDPVDEDW